MRAIFSLVFIALAIVGWILGDNAGMFGGVAIALALCAHKKAFP